MEPQVHVDFLGQNGDAQGQVASHIQANAQNQRLDVGTMRPYISTKDGKPYISVYMGGDPKKSSSYRVLPQTNATLRRDEWKQLDDAVLAISDYRLGGVQDLISKNLTFNLGNAMGTTVFEWHDVSDAMEADMTMDGVTRAQGDRPEYTTNYLPLPIIHVDYEINSRVLENSRRLGNPLDTASAERAARRVDEKVENLLFTDTTYAFGGGTIYSYLNHPNRNQITLSGRLGGNWDSSNKTGKQIVDDVLAMKQDAISARHYGPYQVYIPTDYETVLDDDYDTTTPGTTIRERILKIERVDGIQVIDTLPADTVVLVQMTPDVVRLIRGMGLQNVEWSKEGQMVTKYKVMTIQVPQIRSDQDGRSGIVHLA